MSGTKFLADTNTIIYFFNGHPKAINALDGKDIFVSAITDIELLSFHGLSDESREGIKEFLEDCTIFELTEKVKNLTINIKKAHKIKLPDAIIAAAAQFLKIELITFDKGFAKIPDLDLVLLEY